MNPKLKLVITIIIALVLLGLFFWATSTISNLTGHVITGSSVASPVDIGNSDIGVEEVNGGNQDGSQDSSRQG